MTHGKVRLPEPGHTGSPMADILQFKARQPATPVDKTLCRNGHHKWQVVKQDPFAVHRGELITRYRCERCAQEKTKSH